MLTSIEHVDAAVVIGRFQPFHNGHRALVAHALALAPRVFIVLGSAHSARSPKNPWTYEERVEMIRHSFPVETHARLTFLAVRDYFDESRWRSDILCQLAAYPAAPRVALVGHFKDHSSGYLSGFKDWSLASLPQQGNVHATRLRDGYFAADAASVPAFLESVSAAIPPTTRSSLDEFARTATYTQLAAEWHALRDYRAAWSSTPFPPVFVTVDAVVTCAQHVLLIQRGRCPGRGLWALPGGFLEVEETTLESALRELVEETQLQLPPSTQRPVARALFDHPARSQRGRTLSQAFHFELGDRALPQVIANDDAAVACWTPLSTLRSLERQLFDDHFHILDTFLNVLG